jgi:aryl-alcohol dehydrogenase-like predicted oxidoreductase
MSKLGFGCMGLTGAYNSPLDDEAGIAVITHAFRRGVTFFDTSDVYGPHTNEILLGKVRPPFRFLLTPLRCVVERVVDAWPMAACVRATCVQALKQLPREQVQVATKFGIRRDGSGVGTVCGKPEYVRACCEASLRRLGIDCIDLYYQHRIDTTIPIEDTVSAA